MEFSENIVRCFRVILFQLPGHHHKAQWDLRYQDKAYTIPVIETNAESSASIITTLFLIFIHSYLNRNHECYIYILIINNYRCQKIKK